MPATIYSVREFNELLNIILNEQVGEVTIKGEISGYQVRQNKWVSFDLKDGDSCINCFTSLYQLDMPLTDGQEVHVTGKARIYVPNGRYSFNVRAVELVGEGALQKAFEMLKEKLMKEGLFDAQYKKPIPRFPQTIGLVTSKDGAAIHDIQKVLMGRMGGLTLYLTPVLVQGKDAPDDLVAALHHFNAYQPVDVIIFGRGGGSLEDLQAFNSEKVARAIFASKIPIISGIGHEHNTSIADLVADIRAATPSNAAEMCVQDRLALLNHVDYLTRAMEETIQNHIAKHRQHLFHSARLLPQLAEKKVVRIRATIERFQHCLETSHQTISHARVRVQRHTDHMVYGYEQAVHAARTRIQEKQSVLQALSPTNVLERGYSITYDLATNKPITCRALAPTSGKIKTQLKDGEFTSTVDVKILKPRVIAVKPKNQFQLFEQEGAS